MTHVDQPQLEASHDELSELAPPSHAAEMPSAPEANPGAPIESEREAVDDEAIDGAAIAEAPAAAASAPSIDDSPAPASAPELDAAASVNETAVEPDQETSQPTLAADVLVSEASAEPIDEATASAEPGSQAMAEPAAVEAPAPPSPEERVESVEAEVNAAPHKVYSLGKVRRILTEMRAAGAAEALIGRLETVEASILGQINERKSAKERIIEQADALKDSQEWRATGDKLRALFEEWKTIGGAGKKLDDELWHRFIAAREHFSTRRTEHFVERQQVWAVTKAKKEALIAEVEALGASTEWRSTADKIRNFQEQWKHAGSAGREADNALWDRFNSTKQAFFDNRTAVRDANRQAKEALFLEAEALKDSSDWRLTGEAMKAMQTRWKEIGSAGKAAEDMLWERFRAATNAFFERREGAFAGKRQEERENLAKKQEIVAKAEALQYTGDGLSAAREARDLQAQWKAIGHANREQADALWLRFRAACDRIFEGASSERDRQHTEWETRMREAMTRKREQLASTRKLLEQDEANLNQWRLTLLDIRSGGRSNETEGSLDTKILRVINHIRAKQERIEELRATIADMDAKMRD